MGEAPTRAGPERPSIEFEMVVLDTDDPTALGEFYAELLGWTVVRRDERWVTVRADHGMTIACQLAIGFRPPTWPTTEVPQQFHFDLLVFDLDAAEAYALSLGARRVPSGDRGSYRVFADPSGHFFCLTR